MAREYPKSITQIDPKVRCLRIYPTENSDRNIKDLKTIGIRLSKEQAIHLAKLLSAVSQVWTKIDITAWRFKKRKSDGTYHITVTSFRSNED